MHTMHPRRSSFASYAEYAQWSRRRLERSGLLGTLFGALLAPLAWLARHGGHTSFLLLVFALAFAAFLGYARYLQLHGHLWKDNDSVRGMKLQTRALASCLVAALNAALALTLPSL
jgi:hypothetical protein